MQIIPAGTWRKYNVASTSMQRHNVASTLRRRYIYVKCPLGCVSWLWHFLGIFIYIFACLFLSKIIKFAFNKYQHEYQSCEYLFHSDHGFHLYVCWLADSHSHATKCVEFCLSMQYNKWGISHDLQSCVKLHRVDSVCHDNSVSIVMFLLSFLSPFGDK